jgi:hypothetical protein
MEWNDLPPGRAIRQAAADGRRRCRDLVMGKRGEQRWRGMGDAKLQHPATIRGGRSPPSVTGLTIHDIVMSSRFPSPIFFSKAFKFQHKRCSPAGPIDKKLSHFRRCAMISTWSEWKRYPRPGRGENIEAPITHGIYEVRYAGTGALHSFEAVDNVAQALAQLAVGSRSWFSCREPSKLPDLEYRTCATSSKADAKAAAQRMIGRRETYMSGAA